MYFSFVQLFLLVFILYYFYPERASFILLIHIILHIHCRVLPFGDTGFRSYRSGGTDRGHTDPVIPIGLPIRSYRSVDTDRTIYNIVLSDFPVKVLSYIHVFQTCTFVLHMNTVLSNVTGNICIKDLHGTCIHITGTHTARTDR